MVPSWKVPVGVPTIAKGSTVPPQPGTVVVKPCCPVGTGTKTVLLAGTEARNSARGKTLALLAEARSNEIEMAREDMMWVSGWVYVDDERPKDLRSFLSDPACPFVQKRGMIYIYVYIYVPASGRVSRSRYLVLLCVSFTDEEKQGH